jgi:hemerythrin-like metal-binding protein
MPFLTWDDGLSIGVPSIDDEHKRMIEIVVSLHNSMIAGMSDDCFAGLFDSLVDCTETHFRHEEELMAQTQYPGAARHCEEHEKLRLSIKMYREDIVDRRDATRVHDMMEFLKIWLMDHIEGEDHKLGTYLAKTGAGLAVEAVR